MGPPKKSFNRKPGICVEHGKLHRFANKISFKLEEDVPGIFLEVDKIHSVGQRQIKFEQLDRVQNIVWNWNRESYTMVSKKKKKDKPKKLSRLTNDDLGSLFADGNGGKLHRFANKISFKALWQILWLNHVAPIKFTTNTLSLTKVGVVALELLFKLLRLALYRPGVAGLCWGEWGKVVGSSGLWWIGAGSKRSGVAGNGGKSG
nr:hypothetical protein [Tanacetum cinerariifolium]